MGINSEIGQKYNRLKIITFSHFDTRNRKHYLCKCDCGNFKTVQISLLKTGNTKSCGCLAKEIKALTRLPDNYSEITAVILGYKRHAESRGYEWKLSREEVESIIFQNCYYCDSPPSNIKTTKNTIIPLSYNGIDRKDNTKGYEIDNILPCCKICNRAKSNLTFNEFKSWALKIGAMAEQWK